MRQKIFDGKWWYSPLRHQIFRYPKLSETQKGSSTKWFGTVRQNNFDGKSWYSLPPPPLSSLTFSLPGIFWNTVQAGSSTKFFGTVRQKKFDRKSWYSLPPPSPLVHNFFRYQKFCETQKGSPTKFFGTVRQQIFYWKWWYSPLRYKIFRYPIFSETQKGSSTKWFGTVRQNNFDGKSWFPPPLLSLTFFDTRNFLKHRKVPRWIFSALWDKNFWTDNRGTLLHKVQKSVVELMFVKPLWKLISKQ